MTDTPVRLARYPQDTQQNKVVYLVSVLASFHTTPSGVVFFQEELSRYPRFMASQRSCATRGRLINGLKSMGRSPSLCCYQPTSFLK